jgi:hypothetical protein
MNCVSAGDADIDLWSWCFGERHLRHVLLSHKDYYNATRTHLSLNKDAPFPRGAECTGNIVCRPILVDCTINMAGCDLR